VDSKLAAVFVDAMSTLDQFKVLSLSDPNDRLRLVAEICCERYGDYQRMVAIDSSPSPFD